MVSVNYTTDTKQSVNELTGEYEHVEKLTGAVFRYNTETGEAITKTMKWAQIGTTVDDKGNDVPLMGLLDIIQKMERKAHGQQANFKRVIILQVRLYLVKFQRLL